jgi:hypothetical protein
MSPEKGVSDMKRLLIFFVGLMMIFGFSMIGFAQTKNTPVGNQKPVAAEKKEEGAAKMMTFTGKVVTVNTSDKTIVVKGKEGEETFDVSKVTETVQPGQTVRVAYRTGNGKMVASSVRTGRKTAMNGPIHTRYSYNEYSPFFYGYDSKRPAHWGPGSTLPDIGRA